MKENEKPIIRRYVIKYDDSSEKEEILSLDSLSPEEKKRILNEVFIQGLKQLGYKKI